MLPPIHPICRLFPMLSDAELEGLAEDIRRRGKLLEPIVLLQGAHGGIMPVYDKTEYRILVRDDHLRRRMKAPLGKTSSRGCKRCNDRRISRPTRPGP